MEHRSERGSKESWSDLVDLVCGFFFAVGFGPIWPWFVGFFPFFLAVVGGDLVRLLLIFFWSDDVCGGWRC